MTRETAESDLLVPLSAAVAIGSGAQPSMYGLPPYFWCIRLEDVDGYTTVPFKPRSLARLVDRIFTSAFEAERDGNQDQQGLAKTLLDALPADLVAVARTHFSPNGSNVDADE